jgi:hypothetical protein
MSNEQLNGVPDEPRHSSPVPEEEYNKFWERIKAEQTPPTEEDHQRRADGEWAMNAVELRQTYGGQYVAVYQRQVLASGLNPRAILLEAQRISGAPRNRIAVVPIPNDAVFLWC